MLGAGDAAPQGVPGVARDRGNLRLVAVERLRVAALGGHPEVTLEPFAQLARLAAEPIGAGAIAVRSVEVGDAHLRREDVGLHLDQRGRELRPFAVRIAKRLRGVLPALAAHLRPVRSVLDVPVAVRVTVRVAPGERAFRGRQELAPQRAIAGPLHRLREDMSEERRRVDGAVIGPVRNLAEPRQLAAAQLVEDLAGLFLGEIVDLLPLVRGEQAQRPARDVRIPPERLEGADEPVAPERDRVPRDARGGERSARMELEQRP